MTGRGLSPKSEITKSRFPYFYQSELDDYDHNQVGSCRYTVPRKSCVGGGIIHNDGSDFSETERVRTPNAALFGLSADDYREENITEAKLEEIAKQYGYQFLEGERAEYTQLLRASVDNLQRVSEMEGGGCHPFTVETTK